MGVGSRVGANRPKQFIEILGKPIIYYTTMIYQQHSEVDAIEIVCHKSWRDYLEKIIKENNLTKVKWIADGGETFQESVMNGMNFFKDKIHDDDIVMIHYGASPFTSQETLTNGINVCKEKGMSASCIPCYQLIGSSDNSGESKSWVDRDKLTQVTCPQSFKYSYLQDVYKRAEKQGLLEKIEPHTTSLMYALGDTVYKSYGDQTNIKITTKEDLKLFEGFVLASKESRLYD